MRQYQVPQFIDIEDRIVGPLTLKQFLYLVGGGGIVAFSIYTLPIIISILIALPISALSLSLAFVKINGIPFPKVLGSYVNYLTKPHLYIWKQLPEKATAKRAMSSAPEEPLSKVPTLTESKLQDLAWSLDIKDKTD